MTLIHGSGIFMDGKGILITGPSGSGKSDLALRLMALGAELVGDDYVILSHTLSHTGQGRVMMRPSDTIAGRMEVRGVGIVNVDFRADATVDMVVNLVGDVACLERLPEKKTTLLDGVRLPCLDLFAFEVSAPEKLRAALTMLSGNS
ncbi:HPr kinase/phosphorylase [hydrothermal vent metagenome]|uniref:HPr kinase/phosphorylase n=1 Tax=hydrothermal vent metagenome TaxID=652676 RepID=A0A3B0TB67_9ZZZZ